MKDEINEVIDYNKKKSPSGLFKFYYQIISSYDGKFTLEAITISYFSFDKFLEEFEKKFIFMRKGFWIFDEFNKGENSYFPYKRFYKIIFRYKEVRECLDCKQTQFLEDNFDYDPDKDRNAFVDEYDTICDHCRKRIECQSCGEGFWLGSREDATKKECDNCLKIKGVENDD